MEHCLEMPEWMDDSMDGDNHLDMATFDQDGTFTRSSSNQQSQSEKQTAAPSKSNSNESLTQPIVVSNESIQTGGNAFILASYRIQVNQCPSQKKKKKKKKKN
jgi:hypothetical protein